MRLFFWWPPLTVSSRNSPKVATTLLGCFCRDLLGTYDITLAIPPVHVREQVLYSIQKERTPEKHCTVPYTNYRKTHKSLIYALLMKEKKHQEWCKIRVTWCSFWHNAYFSQEAGKGILKKEKKRIHMHSSPGRAVVINNNQCNREKVCGYLFGMFSIRKHPWCPPPPKKKHPHPQPNKPSKCIICMKSVWCCVPQMRVAPTIYTICWLTRSTHVATLQSLLKFSLRLESQLAEIRMHATVKRWLNAAKQRVFRTYCWTSFSWLL